MNNLELVQKFGIKIDPWYWMTVISAIPKMWKHKIKHENYLDNLIPSIKDNEIYIIINNNYKPIKHLTSKEIYQKLIRMKIQEPTAIQT